MRKNIILCGVGGQGIVLTSKLLAAAAMAKGIPVMSAETIGMAQKGGSVFSFLRMGEELYSPLFPKGTADLLIGFEPAEAVRMLPYLKSEGTVVLNTHPIQPVTATLGGGAYDAAAMIAYLQKHAGNLTMLDGDAACRKIGSPKVLNMVMLGAVLRSGVLPLTLEEVTETMERTVKPQFRELNRKALHIEE
ncbi:indolepyruvate oxidoreductase subunit beta [uncultured Ruminococcus sp.]|uniref:indolepyruvate oxidoreductase subunit beta n=1 Tax=Ruminococcus callidus TaxID=40519 RepID=UPI0026738FFD|nr:indolepyruvate oxidoreductase subunit beta [uncultured Ruminococcus sp.]